MACFCSSFACVAIGWRICQKTDHIYIMATFCGICWCLLSNRYGFHISTTKLSVCFIEERRVSSANFSGCSVKNMEQIWIILSTRASRTGLSNSCIPGKVFSSVLAAERKICINSTVLCCNPTLAYKIVNCKSTEHAQVVLVGLFFKFRNKTFDSAALD